MSNIVLNGNSKKLILNGNQYLGSANSPALVSKTVNQNGTYIAADDNANGYSQVTVNVASTPLDNLSVTENGTYVPTPGHGFNEVEVDVQGGADFSVLTPMDYYYRDTDSGEEGDTPEHNLALTKHTYHFNHSNTSRHSHTTYNQNTKYIVVDDDFDAVLQYTLHGYSDSYNYAQGVLYHNDVQIAFLQALYDRWTSVYIPLHLKAGDTLAIRKPEDYGWSYHELFINFVGDPDA